MRIKQNNSKMITVVPYRTDLISKLFMRASGANPYLLGFYYFLLSFVITYLIGLLTGQLQGKNGLAPMYTQYIDNINLAVIAPIGAALLCNLYNSIQSAVEYLFRDEIIKTYDMNNFVDIINKLNSMYNNIYIHLFAFILSVTINVYNFLEKTDSWLSISGGITGIYGRVFIVLNYYIIALIIYKIIVTVWALQRILHLNINIRPMHPDRSGGLKPVGQLAVAMNSFIALLIFYVTSLLVFDPFAGNNPIYVIIFIIIYSMTPFLLVMSLSQAKNKMLAMKEDAIKRLEFTFENKYNQLISGSNSEAFNMNAADDLIRTNKLYEIVESMPVWPYDTASIKRFCTTIAIPLVVFLFDQLINTDSVVWQAIRYIKNCAVH